MKKLGAWTFVAGFVISLLIGLFANTISSLTLTVLVVLGLIVGFLNITENEVHGFLLSSIAFLLVASAANVAILPIFGSTVQVMLNSLVLFIAPATLVVAIRQVFLLARD